MYSPTQPRHAISTLEELQKELGTTVPAAYAERLKADMAFAYSGWARRRTARWNHNSDACLFPIQGEGIHKQQLGATEAARIYTELLSGPQHQSRKRVGLPLAAQHQPHDAWASIGQGSRSLADSPETFKSDYDIGQFRDVARHPQVSATFGAAGGVITGKTSTTTAISIW